MVTGNARAFTINIFAQFKNTITDRKFMTLNDNTNKDRHTGA